MSEINHRARAEELLRQWNNWSHVSLNSKDMAANVAAGANLIAAAAVHAQLAQLPLPAPAVVDAQVEAALDAAFPGGWAANEAHLSAVRDALADVVGSGSVPGKPE